MQDCSISIANALGILQSCTEPSKCNTNRYAIFFYFSAPVFRFDDTITWLLLSGFHGNKDVKSAAHSGATKQQQWVLELMGHQKNMASGVIPMTEGASLEEVRLMVLLSGYFVWFSMVFLTLNMLHCFKDYNRCFHISHHKLDFVQQKKIRFTNAATCCISYDVSTIPADALVT